jgi:hypothetical protein
MADQQRGRKTGAGVAQVVAFFTSASDQARQVVEFFRTADPAEAEAALAIAVSVVKQRTQGDRPEGKPRGRRPKAAEGAGADASNGAQAGAGAAQGSTQRPISVASTNTTGEQRTGRVVGSTQAEGDKAGK